MRDYSLHYIKLYNISKIYFFNYGLLSVESWVESAILSTNLLLEVIVFIKSQNKCQRPVSYTSFFLFY